MREKLLTLLDFSRGSVNSLLLCAVSEFIIWEELYFCGVLFGFLLLVGGAIILWKILEKID